MCWSVARCVAVDLPVVLLLVSPACGDCAGRVKGVARACGGALQEGCRGVPGKIGSCRCGINVDCVDGG